MPAKRLTVTGVEKLKAKAKTYTRFDTQVTGFGVRVTPTGVKSWVLKTRVGKTQKWLTLSRVEQLPIEKARIRAAQIISKSRSGVDAAGQLLDARKALRSAPTVAELAEDYVAYAKHRKRTWADEQRQLEKDVLPRIGELKVRDVRRADIARVRDEIANRGARIQANRTLALLKTLFYFALDHELIDKNPAARMKRVVDEKERQRVLKPDEIRAFDKGLDKASMDPGIRVAFRLCLLTGQRVGEVVSARWEHIDFEEKVWTIPPSSTKANRLHPVPLSNRAVSLFRQAQLLARGSEWVFPAPRARGKHIEGGRLLKALHDSRKHFPIEDFRPHDLRRTFATWLGELGVPRLVVRRALNHTDKSTTAIYDRYTYQREVRKALDRWADRLDEILSGGGEHDAAAEA